MACLHARLAHGPGKNQTQNVIGSRKCPGVANRANHCLKLEGFTSTQRKQVNLM